MQTDFNFIDELTFDYLRKNSNGEYETYADIGLNEWITMKIEFKDKQAKLFLKA